MIKELFKSKITKIAIAVFIVFFSFLFLFPIIFQKQIENKFRKALENQLVVEASFSSAKLTFFRHFPALTLSADEFFLAGSAPFPDDTLFYAKDLSIGVGLLALLKNQVKVDEIYLNDALIRIMRDRKRDSNFDILKPSETVENDSTESKDYEMEITAVYLKNSQIDYLDTSLGMEVKAVGIGYSGSGKFADQNIDLLSKVTIDDFRLIYGGIPILNRDRVSADLLTQINTESTTLNFTRNDLVLNELPVKFIGKLEFVPEGYDMNFVLESFDADLKNMLSIIPNAIFPDLERMKTSGKGDIVGSLQGLYAPELDQMPALVLNLQVREGSIAHDAAKHSIEDLSVGMNLLIPKLDPAQLEFDVDTIGFKISEGFFNGSLAIQGLNPMRINTTISSKMNLQFFKEALGIENLDYRGDLALDLVANGFYAYQERYVSPTLKEQQITSLPPFNLTAKFKDGYLKWANLPEAIKDINFDLMLSNADSLIENTKIQLQDFNFQVLDQVTKGYFNFDGPSENKVDANLTSKFNLADIPKFYPLDSGYQLNGMLDMNLAANGNYIPKKQQVPVMDTQLKITTGYILTPYYPEPIQDLSLILNIKSENTSFKDVKLDLQPVSFTFADHPFKFTANLENLADLKYQIESEGRLDLGKLYAFFGIEETEIDGYLLTDFQLEGSQKDAQSGNFNKLNNSGRIEAENIIVFTSFLPAPLKIEKGVLDFSQEKINMENIQFDFKGNQVLINGYVTNYLDYFFEPEGLIQGKLNFKSSYINLDDFMFFAEETEETTESSPKVTGVILPPKNLAISLAAQVDSVSFKKLKLRDFKGEVSTAPGEIRLKDTSFGVADGIIQMNSTYRATDPFEAEFEYEVKAKSFNIQKAYQEIDIFRELVSFAEYAQGDASLDYKLAGRLDANMYPILPSIEGGGTLGLNKVKMMGFKLMNSIAKETENEELTDPELSDVVIKTSIDNNLITIPRTKMKIAGFRPRFEGQVSLDGDMSIGVRLGLPPLGLLGIPMKITGNYEVYDMKIGKITKSDELEEIEDVASTTKAETKKTEND